MEIFFQDKCSDSAFLNSKVEIANFDVPIGHAAIVKTPFFELNTADVTCQPVMSVLYSADGTTYLAVTDASARNEISAIGTNSVTFSAPAGSTAEVA
jgi:hypothetical protein